MGYHQEGGDQNYMINPNLQVIYLIYLINKSIFLSLRIRTLIATINTEALIE
jgi:hypothetical protein